MTHDTSQRVVVQDTSVPSGLGSPPRQPMVHETLPPASALGLECLPTWVGSRNPFCPPKSLQEGQAPLQESMWEFFTTTISSLLNTIEPYISGLKPVPFVPRDYFLQLAVKPWRACLKHLSTEKLKGSLISTHWLNVSRSSSAPGHANSDHGLTKAAQRRSAQPDTQAPAAVGGFTQTEKVVRKPICP